MQLASRTTALNYKRADWDGLRQSLRLLSWVDLLNDRSVNVNVDHFYSLLEAAIRDSIPTVTLRRRHPPWFDGELRTALTRKEAAFRRKKRNPTPDSQRDFSEKRRVFKAMSNIKFSEYLKRLVNEFKDNPKRFWAYVKCLKASRKTSPVLVHGNVTATTDKERAELLNRAFATKFTQPCVGTLPVAPQFDLSPLSEFGVSEGAVLRILESVKTNKACGPDGISARIVRECANELVAPLTLLFRQSLAQGTFPDKWKEANIVPIHKKGSTKEAANYRSVSLLPLFGKVLERIVCDILFTHVRTSLSEEQHGFIPHRSCETNLATLVGAGWQAISNGTQLDCIYTDFSAAFQSVDHRLLLHKLECSYSISGPALALLGSFLHDRQQRVVLNGQASSWIPVTSGTPEGSLLSPLLFILFINDLPSHVQSGCLMFADDVKMYREVRSGADADLLHADLARLVNWSSTWRLKLNASKCKAFTITLKRAPVISPYAIDGEALEHVTTMRDLGVVLDQKLTFESHIDCIVKKGQHDTGSPDSITTGRWWESEISYRCNRSCLLRQRAIGARILQYCVERGGQVTHGSHRAHSTQIPHLADGAFDHEF